MTDKQLEELQNILKSALELRSKMNECMCSFVLSGDNGCVYIEQFTHLVNARNYIDSSINLIEEEIRLEMVKSGKI